MSVKKIMTAAAGASEPIYIESVFSTYLYTGNGSTQTITNGIDLSGKGGMTWFKCRNNTNDHLLFDTERGATKLVQSSTTAAQSTVSNTLTAFNNDGFTLGSDASNYGINNSSSYIYTSWTFRKQAKFFDVVTYTGDDAVGRKISHNLGSVPGCIIVKRTDSTSNWIVGHRSLTSWNWVVTLNTTNAAADAAGAIFGASPTSTNFQVDGTNGLGNTYVAYLFAHDAGGFGASGTDNVISCGSYTGTDATVSVSLGWEPQFILVKNVTSTTATYGRWGMYDVMRGFDYSGIDRELFANSSGAEADLWGGDFVDPTPTGFNAKGTLSRSSETYIYIAIRRGPMRTPTDATKVFVPSLYTGTNADNRLIDTTIAPDMVMIRQRNDTVLGGMVVGDRLRGQPYLLTGTTAAEVNDADSFDAQIVSSTEYGTAFSSMSGVWVGNDATSKLNANTTSNNHIVEAFKRAPGFFDVVCYTGTGSATTISHNLGVVPELIIVKQRSGTSTAGWATYHSALGSTNFLTLNSSSDSYPSSAYWNNTSPTSSVFSIGTDNDVNRNTSPYVAYLFATCPGVSKVGSYTGNGSSQTINCGFTSGARFLLIKRTDYTGDWYVFDTARGIASGNDPFLLMNSTDSEQTQRDAIDPDNSGFIVNNDATNFPINVNNATYLYLAIA